MNARFRSPGRIQRRALLLPVATLCFFLVAPGRTPDDPPSIPVWAAVSPQQISEARRLGVAVAYEEPRAGLRFVLIPGSPEASAFYLSITETTNAQYHRFRPNHFGTFRGDDRPADCIDHADVLAFAAWVSEAVSHGGYRLPTEAEWEVACRAGTTTEFAFGDELTNLHANFYSGARVASDDPDAPGGRLRTTPVGSYPPNAWGLFDMHGNLREWCSGRSGPGHVATRGGSWRHSSTQARSGYREESELASVFRDPDIGFRLARSIERRGGR